MVTQVELLTGFVNVAIPEVYQKGMSYYEVLTAVVNKVNELIKQSNEYFSSDVQTVMTDILIEWKNNGELDDLITVALGDQVTDLAGVGRTNETVKDNADSISDLAGVGRTDETVIGNANAISNHENITEIHRNIYYSETEPSPSEGADGDIYIVKDEIKTWTPTFKFGGDDTGLVYGNQKHGIYYRIGDFCYFILSLRLADRKGLTGTVTIEGLPFNQHADRPYSACAVDFVQNLTWPSDARSLYGFISPETNTIELRFNTTGSSGDIKVDGSMCDSGGFFIRMQGFYQIA